MNTKQFIASIYLNNNKAVKGLEDHSVLSDNPVRFAESYSDQDVDGIIVFDLSDSEEIHLQHMDILENICKHVNVPVYCGGHIQEMLDVERIFVAGCSKVILHLGKNEGLDMLEEVCERYGNQRIAATIASSDNITINKVILERCASELILIDEHALSKCLGASELPCIVFLPEVLLEKMLFIMEKPNVVGVSGNIVNENVKEILTLKKLCKEQGLEVRTFEPPMQFSEFKLLSDGLMPVVVQDYKTNQVLMVAYMNEEAYLTTLRTGKMTYYSRSRKELWIKGLTSGHFQYVKQLSIDCDNDTLLAKVYQIGAACHTGNYSCFYRDLVPMEMEYIFQDVD